MSQLVLSGASNATILFHVADFPDKCNYYQRPSHRLNQFDEARAILRTKDDKSFLLRKDIYQEIITPLYAKLFAVLEGQKALPAGVLPGNMGLEANDLFWNKETLSTLRSYQVWSHTNYIHTFLYRHNEKIYMEVFPLYPWVFLEPEDKKDWFSFAHFMRTYQHYAVVTIPHDVACQWRDRLACLMHELSMCHDPLEE